MEAAQSRRRSNSGRTGSQAPAPEAAYPAAVAAAPPGRCGMSGKQAPVIRTLVAELGADARSGQLRAGLFTGFFMAVLVVVFGPALASTVFAGPLTPFVAQATGMMLFGCCALCLITALTGSYRGTVSVPNFPPAAALFTIGSSVAASMSAANDEALFATMCVVVALSTLTTAICFMLIGWFRRAALFRFLPYPLVGGFLAGLGWVLSVGGVSIACGITLTWDTVPRLLDPGMVLRWAPGLAFALVVLAVTKIRPHYLVLPTSIAIAVGLCHAALALLGVSAEEAREAGILFVGIPAEASWPPAGLGALTEVDWHVVAVHIPGILGVMLIALICIVLNAGALELGSGAQLDMNRDFRAEGVACLVAGLGGSSPGNNSSAFSLVSHASGAETRFTGIVVALAVGGVLVFGGDLLAILPTPLLGGMVLFVGLGLLNDWLVATRKTLPWTDYGIVLVVSVVICAFGFLEGVGVGLVAAVMFFVARFSGVDVIAASFTARERCSKRARSAAHRAILRGLGDRVRVYRLSGYATFGNATLMGDRLKWTLDADPAPLGLLLDFEAVSGFDVSAVNVTLRSMRSARARGTRVVLSAVPAHVRSILRRSFPESDWRDLIFEEDLDRGLERCEDLLIAEWDRLYAGSEDARAALFGLSVDHAVRELDRQARFEALMERLGPRLRACAYAAGETIVARGEKQEGLQFLTRGRAMAREEDAGTRVDEYGPGDVLAAEAAFRDHTAAVSVLAVEPCRSVLMTRSDLRSLEQDDLELTVELYKHVIDTMLEYRSSLPPARTGRS